MSIYALNIASVCVQQESLFHNDRGGDGRSCTYVCMCGAYVCVCRFVSFSQRRRNPSNWIVSSSSREWLVTSSLPLSLFSIRWW